MDVNSSTNRVEAERCRNLLINQLRSSQYWQGRIRSQQIDNSVALFNRFVRLSNEQLNINQVIEDLRNEVPNQSVFEEFVQQVRIGNVVSNSSISWREKFFEVIKNHLTHLLSTCKNYINKIENHFFNLLPEKIRRYILPSYRKPLFFLFSFNLSLFILRIVVFNWKPIFNIYLDHNHYRTNGDSYTVFEILDNNYPTFLDIVYEVLSFFVNILTSIIPLSLPILTLHLLSGQNAQR